MFKSDGTIQFDELNAEDRTGNEVAILAVDSNGELIPHDTDNTWVTVTNANSPYTLVEGDDFIKLDASSGNISVTILQGSQMTGKVLKFVRTDSTANTITIVASTGSILGGVSYTSQYDTGEMWSDGTNYYSHQ